MFSLNARIIVYETVNLIPTPVSYEFDYVKDVSITSSYDTLTDTATIIMPKKVFTNLEEEFNPSQFNNINNRDRILSIHDFFKLENFIEIFLGYDGDYKPAFRGYITSVKGDAPVTIMCQDAMYACKKVKAVVDNSLNTAADILNIIAENPSVNIEAFNPREFFTERLTALGFPFRINALDENLGSMVIKRGQSICQLFDELKKHGIRAFFKMEALGPVLTITNNPQQYGIQEIGNFIDRNFIETPLVGEVVKRLFNEGLQLLEPVLSSINEAFSSDQFLGSARFRFKHNIIDDNLTVVEEEVKNTRIRVEKYFKNSNTPIQIEIGDSEGQLEKTYVLHAQDEDLPNDSILFNAEKLKVEAELIQYAAFRALERRVTGLKGSFTTFGEPFIRPTDRVTLDNAEDKEKNGTFQVKSVKRTYGLNGYRQEIELGRKIEIV